MKKTLFLILLVAMLFSKSMAQTPSVSSREAEIAVTVADMDIAVRSLDQFLYSKSLIRVTSRNERSDELNLTFTSDSVTFYEFIKYSKTFGVVSRNRVSIVDISDNISQTKYKLAVQKEKYARLQKELSFVSDTSFVIRRQLFSDIDDVSDEIQRSETELKGYLNKCGQNIIDITFEVESTTPEHTRISFVNMPGFEYSQLFTENPTTGTSFEIYDGYSLKYLFTRGKSYCGISVYKAQDKGSDTAAISEIFLFTFGQDFYSRYLGRGSRKFLNLYTGYNVGASIFSGDSRDTKTSLYVMPSVGLELFKNKYILLDAKVSYFVPFRSTREMRGLNASVSFNFVF